VAAPDALSFDFIHLDRALKDSWRAWKDLTCEISHFEPVDLTQDASFRSELLAHFHKLNPGSSDADLQPIVEWAMKTEGSTERQFSSAFDVRLMNSHVIATLLSLSLCEALINSVLAVGFTSVGRPDAFEQAQSVDIRQKWIGGPKAFAPSYSLDAGSALAETLREMVRRRNALVHYKVTAFREGREVLSGSDWKVYTSKDLVKWTERFFSVPYDLVANALSCGEISAFGLILDRGPIEQPDAHRPKKMR
jgi:hypothetical protein